MTERLKAFAAAWPDAVILQEVLAKLPWYDHMTLLDKLPTEDLRLWYVKAAIQHGWSRNVLVHQIETRLHERQGTATTNFQRTLSDCSCSLGQLLNANCSAIADAHLLDCIGLQREN